MPNLKDIKSRISSVQNTKKITKAMKMVAAAKVKKAENTVKAARPFSDELLKLCRKMLATVGEYSTAGLKVESALDNYPELLLKREIKSEGLLVITSNKGLAGAYNANIIKAAISRIKANTESGIRTIIYPVGQKAVSAFKHKPGNYELRDGYISIANEPTATGANIIAEDIAEDFVSGKIDRIDIITTHFNNMMSYNIVSWEVLPVKIEKAHSSELDALMDVKKSKVKFVPISKYPSVQRDLAFVIDRQLPVENVVKVIEKQGRLDKEMVIRDIEVFDVYQGEHMDPSKKSVALSIRFQSDKKTLKEEMLC